MVLCFSNIFAKLRCTLTIEPLLRYFIVRDRRPLHFKLELAFFYLCLCF